MATIIDRAYLDIDGEVIPCSSIDVKISDDKKPVEVMNRENRAIGHSRGVPKFDISAECPMDADSSTDFVQLMLDATEFSVGVEYEGGTITKYLYCVIKDVSITSKSGDQTNYKLEISGLDKA